MLCGIHYIVSSNKGNLADMLRLEKDFIEERYTPFEEQRGSKSSLRVSHLDNYSCSEPAVTDTDERG